MRFGMTCREARQLVSSSPLLFRQCDATCYGRKQSLAVLRWLGGGCRSTQQLILSRHVQRVPVGRQLHYGISMQGPRLEELTIM